MNTTAAVNLRIDQTGLAMTVVAFALATFAEAATKATFALVAFALATVTKAAFAEAAAEAATAAKATFVAARALAAFIAARAATLTAALATFIAAGAFAAAAFIASATFFVTHEVAGAFFEHEAGRAFGDRNRLAIATFQFIPGRARGRWCGNAFAGAHFIAARAFGRRNRGAVPAGKDIAGWAFGTVLVVARAAAPIFAVATAGQGQGAAHAKHQEAGREQGCEALLHKRSLWSRGGPTGRLHRPQLHSVECQRVERRTPVAKHVGDVPQIVGEVFVFV